jgi:hypothetical protein
MIRTIILILLFLPEFVGATAAKVAVVSCTQDYDVAKIVAESLGAPLVVTRWGVFTEDDREEIEKLHPQQLIIIGGPYAVPLEIERLGIPFERVGGRDRLETARLALKRFFNFETNRSYVLPSIDEVRRFLIASNSTICIVIGNTSVSRRWGAYYAYKLKDFAPIRFCSEIVEPRAVIVGNTENNEIMADVWYKTGLPKEASLLPIVCLKDDTLFITGSDQNIFYSQRTFEKIGVRNYDSKDLLVFALFCSVILLFLSFLTHGYLRLLSVGLIAIFLSLHLYFIPEKGQMVWDSLYVYLDGALALLFQGRYETILDIRSLPGTSFLTYIYFLFTAPTDINANLLVLLCSTWIIASSFLLAYRTLGEKASVVILLLLVSNPLFHKQTLVFSSDIPFVAFLMASALPIAFETPYSPLLSGIFLGISMIIRPSAVLLLFPLLLYYKQSRRLWVLVSLPIFIAGIWPSGDIFGYMTEVSVKSYKISAYALRYISSLFFETNIVMAPALLIGLLMVRSLPSQFILLHMFALSFWVAYDVRYLLPVVPFAVILQGEVLSKLDKWKLGALVAIAVLLNMVKLCQFYGS